MSPCHLCWVFGLEPSPQFAREANEPPLSCPLLVCPGPSPPRLTGGRWDGAGARSASASIDACTERQLGPEEQEGQRPGAVPGDLARFLSSGAVDGSGRVFRIPLTAIRYPAGTGYPSLVQPETSNPLRPQNRISINQAIQSEPLPIDYPVFLT